MRDYLMIPCHFHGAQGFIAQTETEHHPYRAWSLCWRMWHSKHWGVSGGSQDSQKHSSRLLVICSAICRWFSSFAGGRFAVLKNWVICARAVHVSALSMGKRGEAWGTGTNGRVPEVGCWKAGPTIREDSYSSYMDHSNKLNKRQQKC